MIWYFKNMFFVMLVLSSIYRLHIGLHVFLQRDQEMGVLNNIFLATQALNVLRWPLMVRPNFRVFPNVTFPTKYLWQNAWLFFHVAFPYVLKL